MEVNRVIGGFRYRSLEALDADAIHDFYERLSMHCSFADSRLPMIRDFIKLASTSKKMLPIIIESEPDGVLIGTCAFFDRWRTNSVEIMGFFEPIFEGTETLLSASENLLLLARELFGKRRLDIRIGADDEVKRSLAERCGAVFAKLCDTIEAEYSKILLAERGDRDDELQDELLTIIRAGENKVALYHFNLD
ncbi:MAG: hypothetical protein IJ788_00045 [Oscillospiraceae bacterium]|nr:hypothetical protein [Oscillospiraceae bacterium]